MSEVRMSLEEYDQIIQKSNLYQEIVEAITDVYCSPYEIESYKEGLTHYISVHTHNIELSSLSSKSRQLFQSLIKDNVNKIIVSEDLKDCKYDDILVRVDYGYIEHKEDNVKDGD